MPIRPAPIGYAGRHVHGASEDYRRRLTFMDYLAGYQDRRSELRGLSEPVLMVTAGRPVQVAYLLVFGDLEGRLVRVDVAGVEGDPFQLVADTGRLVPRLLNPMGQRG